MEWKVYLIDWNTGNLEEYNVFKHGTFSKEVKEILKKYKTREEISEQVNKSAMYCFWSKCEYEIIISSWPPNERFKDHKIDVYDQLKINWEQFIDYITNNQKDQLC